ncbi:MAG: crotonase/enoyl-CoA hydratase family protein [Deltaproteobacteria bacterium]|nr:crotonase/enoyl-CoA hydratase family protein [Deltaproteobacteria bacterium]MBW2413685.1 crotonase/enoyl-CoA hydratase family protein [Deltaproteobacteria bacterium]
MSEEIVRYELRGDVALISFDDGKANVISPTSLAALNGALDRAEKEARVVVLSGRPGRFSAGFDLSVMRAGDAGAIRDMVRGGAELSLRLYGFPLPIIAAVTGHALAMGSMILMSVDERIGAAGDFKIGMNETAIGMALPGFAVALARARLAPTHLQRASVNAELYDPEEAVHAGFLDRVVPADQLADAAFARATELLAVHSGSHAAVKQAIRAPALAELRESLAEFG